MEHDWTRRTMVKAISVLGAIGAMPALADPGSSETGVRQALERYAAAWTKGDLALIVACYHDDFTLHYFGHSTLSGDHAGKAEALKALAAFSQRTRRKLMGITAILAGDRLGVIVARERLMQGEQPIEVDRLLVYRVTDGLLAECWVYDQDQRLIDSIIG
ncbi:nuclear transport factor 2 family protein [Sphingomonas sp. ERG5]|uniref:nuclear transport factor 2 family protein n=1 Tax=Sphingomonas sp. ERG5 TaxID=1381597 RepID=UPI00190F519B|nr:nuclear transport factor 2 family protein [Sphingomonas sp. ERG5]